tara:strand:+ start:279 stop:470 length:192 start_codon:yes stop_codon:yes gene_type:complete
MLRTTHTHPENSNSIQLLFTPDKYSELKTTLYSFEQRILKRREEILSLIDKKDSRKYRKYLKR